MYNMTVHAMQVLDSAHIHVSVTETNDLGTTETLFSVKSRADDVSDLTEAYSLERFLDQVVHGLSRALRTS